MLHDIAKGRGGDHSEIGAEIAQHLAPRLGLDDWETETVSWLVRWHLLMSRTAFKRDIDDWKTVSDFVDRVQSPEWLPHAVDSDECRYPRRRPEHLERLEGRSARRALLPRSRRNRDGERTARRPPDDAGGEREIKAARATGRLGQRNARGLHRAAYSDYWLAFTTDEQVRHFELMRKPTRRQALYVRRGRNRRAASPR